ncbi:MAG: rhomboid family intramembrane serine protease, partial [Pseudomonadota bacterium]
VKKESQMSEQNNISPVNPLPPIVVALFLFIAGIELMFLLGERGILGGPEAVGWRNQAINDYSFFNQIFDRMLARGEGTPSDWIRFLSYPFVHLTFTHTLFVCVFLLALGKMVGEVFAAWAVLAVFVVSAVVGALAYGLLLDETFPLIGGYPAVYGLIGAFTFLLWVRLVNDGANQFRAFTLIGFLLFIQLIFGLLFGGGMDWVADIAGFVAGFVTSVFVCPGGWRYIRQRIRRD